MRIAELSRLSGVPLPTIKYYLREGLLAPGRATAPNQADYSAAHLHRLTLVRTLVEVGRLPISSVRAVIAAIDEQQLSLHDTLGVAHDALPPARPPAVADGDLEAALADVNHYIERLGWTGSATSPARHTLAHALVSLRRLGRDCLRLSLPRRFRAFHRVLVRNHDWALFTYRCTGWSQAAAMVRVHISTNSRYEPAPAKRFPNKYPS